MNNKYGKTYSRNRPWSAWAAEGIQAPWNSLKTLGFYSFSPLIRVSQLFKSLGMISPQLKLHESEAEERLQR